MVQLVTQFLTHRLTQGIGLTTGEVCQQTRQKQDVYKRQLIISLIALALVAATAGIIRNRKLQKKIDRGELDAMPEVQEVDAE